jgi:hypothetical protein
MSYLLSFTYLPVCHVTTFNYAMCHILKPYKWIIIMDGGHSYFKKHPKNPHSATCWILMDWWRMMLAWHYHGSCKLVALELHNNYFYIVVIKLHMYAISHTMRCICCNSYNLSNITHVHRNILSCKWSLQLKNQVARLVGNHLNFS